MPLAVIAAFGLIFASVYSLWVMQKVFHGGFPKQASFDAKRLLDLDNREMLYYAAMMLGLVWMGVYPQFFLDLSAPTLQSLLATDTAGGILVGVLPP